MKRTWTLAFFVAAGLLALPAAAQTGAVRGKVVDEQGQPVDGAKVEIIFKGGVTRKFETKTNKKGEYTQVGLQGGIYEIDVTKEGFQVGETGGRVSLGDPTYMPEVKLRAGKAAPPGADKAVEELRAQFGKAAELAQSGKHDEAEALYKDLLVKNPQIPEIHYNLGFIYQQKKDWPAAIAAYQKAVEIRPSYSEAQTALASVYQSSGQGDKAMEVAKQSASGGDAKSHFNLGIVAMNQGKEEEALAAFQKAAELDPTNPEPHYFIGTRSMQMGKLPEAVAALEKYIAMAPANAANLPAAKQILPALKAALPKK